MAIVTDVYIPEKRGRGMVSTQIHVLIFLQLELILLHYIENYMW